MKNAEKIFLFKITLKILKAYEIVGPARVNIFGKWESEPREES